MKGKGVGCNVQLSSPHTFYKVLVNRNGGMSWSRRRVGVWLSHNVLLLAIHSLSFCTFSKAQLPQHIGL